MLLDNRLRNVVNEIRNSKATIDVGTDHGKVILTAILEGRVEHGIASDISPDSLSKAKSLADTLNISLDTRCGDGLHVIRNGEVDTAVIAGMGGNEIIKILTDFDGKIAKLILVPHKSTREVRQYLTTHGYCLKKDYMVRENNFYYSIIVAEIGEQKITRREEYAGLNNLDNEVFRDYIAYRKQVLASILEKTDKAEIREELEILEDISKENII